MDPEYSLERLKAEEEEGEEDEMVELMASSTQWA